MDIDIIIIGVGIVGLSVVLCVWEKVLNVKIFILECGLLLVGVSICNVGFVCFGSVLELFDDMIESLEDEVWALVEWCWIGL